MFKQPYKFQVSKIFSIAYALFLLLGFLLTIGRWISQFSDFVVINSEVNSHISNFSLSLIAYLGIGFSWLLSGIKFRCVTLLGVVFILGNLLCETVMFFLNTTDIVDAYFGIGGVCLVYIFLFLTQKYGLVPLDKKNF